MFSRLYRGVRSVAAWALEPSDIEVVKRCIRLVVRAVAVAISWIALMGIGIVLNKALEYTLTTVNAPETARDLLSPMSWGMPLAIGFAITITSIRDIIGLTMVGWDKQGKN